MNRNVLLIIILVIILILIIKFVGLTGYGVFLGINNRGGKINYDIQGVSDFIQCFDSDPDEDINIKGSCFAQYYDYNKRKIVGMDSADYCLSEKIVVDYGCSRDFSCKELVRECEKGKVCENGKCANKIRGVDYWLSNNELFNWLLE